MRQLAFMVGLWHGQATHLALDTVDLVGHRSEFCTLPIHFTAHRCEHLFDGCDATVHLESQAVPHGEKKVNVRVGRNGG